MSMLEVSYLDLLHELCLQRDYALLVIAQHTPASQLGTSKTELRALTVVKPPPEHSFGASQHRRQRLQTSERIARVLLDTVGDDLDAAAELIVQLLTHRQAKAA